VINATTRKESAAGLLLGRLLRCAWMWSVGRLSQKGQGHVPHVLR